MRRLVAVFAVLAAFGPAAHAAAPASCPGAASRPDRVITGEFGSEQQGSYVLLPFDVPAGTTQVRVRYCYDQPDVKPSGSPVGNTLDLGLYQPRRGKDALWGPAEFRGWGGSSHPEVQVTPQGFKSEAAYVADPRGNEPGLTTRGFVPGPIPAGTWAAELGVASVTPQTQGDSDGKVAWRVEIDFASNPEYAAVPYAPAPYDKRPARRGAGWYAGDMHVHAEMSNLGAATMRKTFDYAFAPVTDPTHPGAGLDFMTLSDYVGTDQWYEIGRYQADYPGKLIVRSAEVITYRGHINNHGSHRFVDYRTGPVYERGADGSLRLLRGPRPASAIFDAIHAGGGWTQINHPAIFPSAVPTFSSFCRGCPWDYTPQETDYRKVDAFEVATGPAGIRTDPKPGPNPFTATALKMYDDALDTGAHIAAVASSDSHTAGDAVKDFTDVTGAPLGMGTTVVHADELSEKGIQRGVEAGHTYAKIWGNAGPDIRFEARDATGRTLGIMGDTVSGAGVTFVARVLHAEPWADPTEHDPFELVLFRDRAPVLAVPITQDDQTVTLPALGAARYRLQLQRSSSIEAVSTPIWYLG